MLMLLCGHEYEPKHIQGDRLVMCPICGEHSAVKSSTKTIITYKVTRPPAME